MVVVRQASTSCVEKVKKVKGRANGLWLLDVVRCDRLCHMHVQIPQPARCLKTENWRARQGPSLQFPKRVELFLTIKG